MENLLGDNHKKLFCELENQIGEFEMEIEDKFFNYGASAREVVDYWNLGDEDENEDKI